MREILFRGKCELSGLWNTGSLVKYKDDYGNEEYHIVQTDKGYVVVIPETVGQFTGLTDKNGVKIFEGDIVKMSGLIYVIIWDNRKALFFLQSYNPKISTDFYDLFPEDFEVIGNIHDNPKLLETERNGENGDNYKM